MALRCPWNSQWCRRCGCWSIGWQNNLFLEPVNRQPTHVVWIRTCVAGAGDGEGGSDENGYNLAVGFAVV